MFPILNLWAENGTRTRDPNLGKVVLYQLSYFRKIFSKFCKIFATLGIKNFFKNKILLFLSLLIILLN